MITLVICLVLITSACNKGYLEKVPLSGPSDASFFATQDELVLAVNGTYKTLNILMPVDGMPYVAELDDAADIGWDRNTDALQALGNGNQDSNNGVALNMWSSFYQAIGRCNFILDNASRVKDKANPVIYARSLAEARFVRAYCYSMLAELYGGVPLVTHVLSIADAQMPKTSKDDLVKFILSEMDAAAADLPTTYTGVDVGRATKGAALAIKAREALFGGQWDAAISAAQAVMSLNVYALENNYGNLFTSVGQSSKEIIFALQYLRSAASTQSIPYNCLSRNALGASNKIPSQSLVDAFQCTDGLTIDKSPLFNAAKPFANRDPRLSFTVAVPGSIFYNYQFETNKDSLKCYNYTTTPATRVDNLEATNAFATYSGYCWKKYVDIADIANTKASELNVTVIRYAEVLLTYAEAKIEKGELDASVYDAINAIRQRPTVNMPKIPAGSSQIDLRSAVRRERLYELAMEGVRLFDIRRWKIAAQAMNGPLYGRIPNAYLSNAPVIDANGIPDYTNVSNKARMRVIEVRKFNNARDYLWPIPNIEVVTNKMLVQNQGY